MPNSLPRFTFDPVHRPCRCVVCVHARLLRMMRDLDMEYDRPAEENPLLQLPPNKETIQ